MIVAQIFGLLGELIFGLFGKQIIALIGGLIFGLSVGLIIGTHRIEPIEEIKISMSSDAIRAIYWRLMAGLIGGLVFVLTFGLNSDVVIFALIGGLIDASKTEITTRTRANQGMISSAKAESDRPYSRAIAPLFST